jgi:hypothetical protein
VANLPTANEKIEICVPIRHDIAPDSIRCYFQDAAICGDFLSLLEMFCESKGRTSGSPYIRG